MALTEVKFRLSRIVLSGAVFISLCGPATAEVRNCYWCGPLAEQVHRSQRALPCSDPNSQITVCDPGFPYCAAVATSPPYTESRYCVKLYQDECYSLYCNSTRMWRMTCPCRGDLCNGRNTDREDEAFAYLAKLVTKTQNTRIKRALISTSEFISMNTNKNNRIDNTTVEENKKNSNDTIDKNNTADVKNNESKTIDENLINGISSTAVVEAENNISQVTNTNVIVDELKKNENMFGDSSIHIHLPTVNAESSDLKTEIILMSNETTQLVNGIRNNDVVTNIAEFPTSMPEIVKQTVIGINTRAETSTKAAQKEVKMSENNVKPSQRLPTTEAVPHNETPPTTTTTTTTTIRREQLTKSTAVSSQHAEVTTEATKHRNNSAARNHAQIITLVVGIILQY